MKLLVLCCIMFLLGVLGVREQIEFLSHHKILSILLIFVSVVLSTIQKILLSRSERVLDELVQSRAVLVKMYNDQRDSPKFDTHLQVLSWNKKRNEFYQECRLRGWWIDDFVINQMENLKELSIDKLQKGGEQ